MPACDLIVSLTGPARVADALHLMGLMYGVLGLALLGWHRLARSDHRRGHGVVAVPGPRVGFALIVLALFLQALAQVAGACR